MLEYNEQTENLMEIAMMLEQLKGESEYLFEVLTDIDSITWKQKFVDWANEFTETYEPNKDVWPGNYLEVIERFAREKSWSLPERGKGSNETEKSSERHCQKRQEAERVQNRIQQWRRNRTDGKWYKRAGGTVAVFMPGTWMRAGQRGLCRKSRI